jgi:hypothetical protein
MRARDVSRSYAVIGVGAAVFLAGALFAAPEPASPPPPLAHGPIATYDAACARCHGPNGSFYGPALGKGKTDAQLRQVIQEMAEGPSQLPPLPQRELDAQTAYHRALIKAEPFLAVTVRTPNKIEGEATSGAAVTVTTGGKTTAAKVEGSHWSAYLAAGNTAPLVSARLGKIVTTLDTARAAFSHSAPLSAENQKSDDRTKSTTGQTTK